MPWIGLASKAGNICIEKNSPGFITSVSYHILISDLTKMMTMRYITREIEDNILAAVHVFPARGNEVKCNLKGNHFTLAVRQGNIH
jgi:hypothetical protein